MAKRRRASEGIEIDRISNLPSEILVSVISRLSYKEAVATSILSHRWRYIWTSITTLNFDGIESLGVLVEEKSWDFVRLVDRAITLQETSVVELFRVFYDLNKTHSKSINKWLEFAFARKVQRLELNLVVNEELPRDGFTKFYQLPYRQEELYTFPNKFYSGLIDCTYLKSIVMSKVNLNGKAIEFFLHNCPLLEDLSVFASMYLSRLKIVKPSPSFKRLEISSCNNLWSVEIRDANLVHLKYDGDLGIDFVIEDVPFLTSLSVGGAITCFLTSVINSFSSILPQLETFEIRDANIFNFEDTQLWYDTVKMIRLKQLVVEFTDSYCFSLLHVTKLMDASPSLERLVLKRFHGELGKRKKRLKIHKMEKHFGLKHVEFKGYHGCNHHLEMVSQLLRNAVNLESLVIDTSGPAYTILQRYKADYINHKDANINPSHAIYEKDATALATKQLKNLVPLGIKLDIIGPTVDLKRNATVRREDDSCVNDLQSFY